MSSPKPPTKIGPYRIVGQIGEGGMGVVYEAIQQPLERRVAIKVLLTKYAHDRALLKRFFNEARAVSRIEHPSIVQVTEFGQLADGTAYMVMEYLRGESLTSRLDRLEDAGQRLAVVEVLQLGAQLADALSAAHEKGIVHRDMKPGNIMLVRDSAVPGGERVKILDFGIAKLSDRRRRTTDTDLVIGTPPYMSPEQCRGAGGVDAKTDVYALGIMLFEMFTGRPPFLAGEGAELLAQHMLKEPPLLLELSPQVPTEVAALVHRLLVKDKSQRPAMSEAGAELARMLSRLSGFVIVAPRPIAYLAVASGAAVSGTGNSPTTLGRSLGETRRLGQRARWLMLAGAWAVALTAGLGVAAYFWLRPSLREQPAVVPAVSPIQAVRSEAQAAVVPAPLPELVPAAAAEPQPKGKTVRASAKKRALVKKPSGGVGQGKPASVGLPPAAKPHVRFED